MCWKRWILYLGWFSFVRIIGWMLMSSSWPSMLVKEWWITLCFVFQRLTSPPTIFKVWAISSFNHFLSEKLPCAPSCIRLNPIPAKVSPKSTQAPMFIHNDRLPKTSEMYSVKKLVNNTIALTMISPLPHLLRRVALKYESTPFFKWSKKGVPAVLNLMVLNCFVFFSSSQSYQTFTSRSNSMPYLFLTSVITAVLKA